MGCNLVEEFLVSALVAQSEKLPLFKCAFVSLVKFILKITGVMEMLGFEALVLPALCDFSG